MRSTLFTRKPWVRRLNSVTIIASCAAVGVAAPMKRVSAITEMILPRRLTTPSIPNGRFGAGVTTGACMTSPHLEHVDAENFRRSQREQQYFHPVRAGETRSRVGGLEQA
jgi:hypothetical protein